MVGGLYFYFLGQIFPQFAFDPLFDLSIALMAFFGGLGTITGPLLGALVLESLQQYLTQTFSSDATYLIAYGVLFLAVILLLPRGIIPGITELVRKRRARRREPHPGGARGDPARRASRGPRDGEPDRGQGRLEVLRRHPRAVALRPRGPRGRDQRADRPQRLRQDDAVQRDHRLRAHPAGRGSLRRRRDHQRAARPRVQARDRTHVPAHAAVHPPVRAGEHARRHPAQGELAARGAAPRGVGRARSAARWSCWSSSGSRGSPTSRRATCPTASASCSSSPRCWSPTRRSCCSTSPPAASTRR